MTELTNTKIKWIIRNKRIVEKNCYYVVENKLINGRVGAAETLLKKLNVKY